MFFNTASAVIKRSFEGAWGVYPHLPSGNILVSDMQEGLFVIEAIDSGCDPNANLESCNKTSSIKSLLELNNELKISPNPVTNNLNFTVSEKLLGVPAEVSVTGIDGSVHFQEENFNLSLKNSLNLKGNHSFANGLYFLQIRTSEFISVQKFIVAGNK